LFLGLLVFASTAATARPNEPISGCIDQYLDRLKPTGIQIDTISKYARTCAELAQLESVAERDTAANAVLNTQRFNTYVLLWLVVGITFSGVGLAGMQLLWAYRLAQTGHGALPDGSETTVSKDSLVIKSSVVGVIILGFSLVFFVVFVMEVYPMTLVGVATPAPINPDRDIGTLVSGPPPSTTLPSHP